MNLKNILLTLSLMVFITPKLLADDAVQYLLIASGIEEATYSNMQETVDAGIQQNPALEPYRVISEDFFHEKGSFRLHHEYAVSTYKSAFSEDEIVKLAKFFKTEAGSKIRHVSADHTRKAMSDPGVVGFYQSNLGVRFGSVSEDIYAEVHKRISESVFQKSTLDELDKRIERLWKAGS